MKSSLLSKLSNNSVFFDSSCFIYLFEYHPIYLSVVKPIFSNLETLKIKVETSDVTVAEVLTKPIRDKNKELVNAYIHMFQYLPNLNKIHSTSTDLAFLAAEIRAKYNLKLMDSLQLAFAANSGADYFLTNDKQLKKCKEIKVLLIKDFI